MSLNPGVGYKARSILIRVAALRSSDDLQRSTHRSVADTTGKDYIKFGFLLRQARERAHCISGGVISSDRRRLLAKP